LEKRISQFTNTFLFVFIGLIAFNIGWTILVWLWQFIFRNDVIPWSYEFFEIFVVGFQWGLFVAVLRVIFGFLSDLLSD
tara:strand:+ start:155 stop:391 length:237 start_codon:yes stop_codon:yes gene_type:complete